MLLSFSRRSHLRPTLTSLIPLVSVISAWWSDRYNTRGVPLIAISLLSIAGWAIFLSKCHSPVRHPIFSWTDVTVTAGANQKFVLYGALYLMVPGIYGLSPVTCAWVANNSEPYYRRASSIAIGFMATNAVGYLISHIRRSTFIYPNSNRVEFSVPGAFPLKRDPNLPRLL